MPIESGTIITNIFTNSTALFIKSAFVLLAILYFFFSLIVIRQVQLMTEIIRTEGGPLLIGFAIVHAGLALGIIVLFIGLF